MDFLEDLLVYPCIVVLFDMRSVIKASSGIFFLYEIFICLEIVRSQLKITNMGLPFRELFLRPTFPL